MARTEASVSGTIEAVISARAFVRRRWRAGRPLLEIAFRWLLDQDVVDSVILGASKLEHLAANIEAAASAPLPAAVRDECDEVWRNLRGPSPAYNR